MDTVTSGFWPQATGIGVGFGGFSNGYGKIEQALSDVALYKHLSSGSSGETDILDDILSAKLAQAKKAVAKEFAALSPQKQKKWIFSKRNHATGRTEQGEEVVMRAHPYHRIMILADGFDEQTDIGALRTVMDASRALWVKNSSINTNMIDVSAKMTKLLFATNGPAKTPYDKVMASGSFNGVIYSALTSETDNKWVQVEAAHMMIQAANSAGANASLWPETRRALVANKPFGYATGEKRKKTLRAIRHRNPAAFIKMAGAEVAVRTRFMRPNGKHKQTLDL